NDVVLNLSSDSAGMPTVIRDNRTEVNLSGSHILNWTNLSLSPLGVYCTPVAGGDYDNENHLSQIRSAVSSAVSPTVMIENDTVIYRKYQAGDAYYFWLVNVHSFEEYERGWDWFTYRGGNSNTTAQQAVISYFTNRSIYNGSITTNVSVLVPTGMTVVDVINRSTLTASWNGNWSMFDVEIPRLAGKLIALYPAAPYSVNISFPTSISLGYQGTLRADIFDSTGSTIRAAFPLYLELLDPAGMNHSYTKYTSTNTTGSYESAIIIGANDPVGSWTLRITELSTNKQNSVSFAVS
ncbi:MAG: hypothetical protein AABX05_01995, partial [Nanoarchaeota archaeon]